MRIPGLPDPVLTIKVEAGPHAKIRALEKAKQEYGPRVEVGSLVEVVGFHTLVFEVKET